MVRIGARSAAAWIVAGTLAFLSAHAHAQPSRSPALASERGDPRPWARGVSEREQRIALDQFLAGNQEFTESRFAQALAKYKDAIRHWDHPAIRFNMAVCLINLDQPVEAKSNLEQSLAYGSAPLGGDLYGQGITYRKLLDAQLVRFRVACPVVGTKVTLDGKYLFTGPGTAEQVVLPGEHQVVGTKAGFMTTSETFVLVAGKPRTYEVRPKVEPRLKRFVPCTTDRTSVVPAPLLEPLAAEYGAAAVRSGRDVYGATTSAGRDAYGAVSSDDRWKDLSGFETDPAARAFAAEQQRPLSADTGPSR